MKKQPKHYESSFKLEVARMVVEQKISIAQVVKDMDIGRSAVSRWVKQYRAEQMGKAGIGKPLTAEQLQNEFYANAFRRKLYYSLQELQANIV